MDSLFSLLLMQALSARAVPMRDLNQYPVEGRNAKVYIDHGEPATDRTIYTVLSLVCMMVLSLLIGSRYTQLRQTLSMKRNIMPILVLALYILALMFILISAALVSGQGLYTYALCRAGTWVCLMFYTSIKAVIYIFLVERVHVVRAPFVCRSKDKIYLSCMTMVVVMYGAVAINSYINNVTEMRPSDGRCHFGIRGIVSIPFVVVNFFTDIVLTGVFFYLLRPVAQLHGMPTVSFALRSNNDGHPRPPQNSEIETPDQRNIRTLLWKSIIGGLLIEIPMAANMVQFVLTKGEELGMLCLSLCLIDVFWDALVVLWLTFGSSGAAAERELSRSSANASEESLGRSQRSTRSREHGQIELNKSPARCYVEGPSSGYVGDLENLRGSQKDATAVSITTAPVR